MISQHARLARMLAEQLDLPAAVRDAVGSAYEQWDGHGWPGELRGDAVPVAARIALARRVRRGGAPSPRRRGSQRARAQAGWQAVRSRARQLCCARAPGTCWTAWRRRPPWQAVIAAEPALAVPLSPAQLDAALTAIASFVDLKSPYSLGHSVAVADLAQEAARRLGPAASRRADAAAGRAGARIRPAGSVELDLGPARTAERGGVGARPHVPVPDRADAAPVSGARPAGRDRGAAPGAAGRQRLPARAVGRRDPRPARILARRRGLSVQARAQAAPRRQVRGRGGGRHAAGGAGPAGWTRTRSSAVLQAAGHRLAAPPGGSRRPDRAGRSRC